MHAEIKSPLTSAVSFSIQHFKTFNKEKVFIHFYKKCHISIQRDFPGSTSSRSNRDLPCASLLEIKVFKMVNSRSRTQLRIKDLIARYSYCTFIFFLFFPFYYFWAKQMLFCFNIFPDNIFISFSPSDTPLLFSFT